jgi:hypothetical protein
MKNKSAVALGKLSVKSRKKKLGDKFAEHMREIARKKRKKRLSTDKVAKKAIAR